MFLYKHYIGVNNRKRRDAKLYAIPDTDSMHEVIAECNSHYDRDEIQRNIDAVLFVLGAFALLLMSVIGGKELLISIIGLTLILSFVTFGLGFIWVVDKVTGYVLFSKVKSIIEKDPNTYVFNDSSFQENYHNSRQLPSEIGGKPTVDFLVETDKLGLIDTASILVHEVEVREQAEQEIIEKAKKLENVKSVLASLNKTVKNLEYVSETTKN